MILTFRRQKVPVTQQFRWLTLMALLFLVAEAANVLSGRAFNVFGIIPRAVDSLPGIFISPLLHGNFAHFIGNLPPLLLFAWLVILHGRLRFFLVTLGVIALGGLGVWFFARPAIHIGASGLVFGYFGFLLVAGLISREFKLLLISILVGFFYGGMLIGVLPIQAFVSFEAHLFGLLAGVFMAFLFGRASR